MTARKLTSNQITILATVEANPGCAILTAAEKIRAKSYSGNQASYAAVHRCMANGWIVNDRANMPAGRLYSLKLTTSGEAALREGYDVM